MKPRFGAALLRLFAVQGSWNYERMIGLGAGVAEEPLLRELLSEGNGATYRDAVARGAHFFNSHPYLAGLAVGATARAEIEHAAPEQIERLRAALTGPLGSLGDRLVWAGWLPLTIGLALVAIDWGAGLWAVAGFLAVYNAGHVALRWWALRAGWQYGVNVVTALRSPLLQRGVAVTGVGMALAMGLALPAAADYVAGGFTAWAREVLGAAGATGFALLYWRVGRGTLTGLRYGLVLVALALLVGTAWR
jgi:mannose PTS system EIID component